MAASLRSTSRTLSQSLRCCRPASLPRSALATPRYQLATRSASNALRYTVEHEWVSLDESSGIATMGITDYAQKSLGDIAYVELPAVGSSIEKGDQIGAVESVKAASDIFAPISGDVEEVNETLDEQPALVNKSPEQDGWLCRIKPSKTEELKDLLDEKAYQAHCEGEDANADKH